MDLLHVIHPLYVISGFAVGFLVGMTGVGGGSLMTPLLIFLFHVHPVTAVGTDLIYACITKTGGSLVHGFNRTIDWRVMCGARPDIFQPARPRTNPSNCWFCSIVSSGTWWHRMP